LFKRIDRGIAAGSCSRAYARKNEPYGKLAGTLADLMVTEAFEFEKRGYLKTSRRFYLYSYAVVSFNWDPLLLWLTFNAHKERNDQPAHLKGCLPLRLFSDLGVMAMRKVASGAGQIRYSTNEAQCMKVNDSEYLTQGHVCLDNRRVVFGPLRGGAGL